MSCEHLICAHCAGPVSEGRCPACRAARAKVHHHHGGPNVSVPLIAAVLLALLLISLTLQHFAR